MGTLERSDIDSCGGSQPGRKSAKSTCRSEQIQAAEILRPRVQRYLHSSLGRRGSEQHLLAGLLNVFQRRRGEAILPGKRRSACARVCVCLPQ